MIHSILPALLYLITFHPVVEGITQAGPVDGYCELKGSVYVTEVSGEADYLIYEEDSEAFAELLVYETDNALFADRPGIWYYVDNPGLADFTVCFVDNAGQADFKVFFTTFESLAGCQHQK